MARAQRPRITWEEHSVRNNGGTAGTARLSCGNVERVLCLRAHTLRDPRRTARPNHLLSLLAVPQTLRFKLWDNGWSEGERILCRRRERAAVQLGIQPRFSSVLCKLLRLAYLQAPRRRSRGFGLPARDARLRSVQEGRRAFHGRLESAMGRDQRRSSTRTRGRPIRRTRLASCRQDRTKPVASEWKTASDAGCK